MDITPNCVNSTISTLAAFELLVWLVFTKWYSYNFWNFKVDYSCGL